MSLPSQDLEELKNDAERLADKLPQCSSKDEALDIAIKAAETSMKALKLAQDPNEKAKLATRFKQLLHDAETIKQSKDWRTAIQPVSNGSSHALSQGTVAVNRNPRILKEPVSTRALPKSEQILLLKASFLHEFKFPPWETLPASEEFDLKDGEEQFLYDSFVSMSISSQLTAAPYITQRHKRFATFRFSRRCVA